MRLDWGLFNHPNIDDAKASALVSAILGDDKFALDKFSPLPVTPADRSIEWEKLRDELMYHNRYFPAVDIDLPRLERLLSPLTVTSDEIPNIWYRARIRIGSVCFTVGEMGSPPNRIATHGRANPAGIPYLYLASTPVAAVSEIRPHTGEVACVAEYHTPTSLKLVDLRSPRHMVSPFLLEGPNDIALMRSDLPFLERLGVELTRPVIPQSAAIEYTPSQYLCEFIKKCGYDGVLYRSSVSDGINMALFNPTKAVGNAVLEYRVDRVSVAISGTTT